MAARVRSPKTRQGAPPGALERQADTLAAVAAENRRAALDTAARRRLALLLAGWLRASVLRQRVK